MAFAAAGAEYCDGAVGDGTSDQFQYYLYNGYEAEDMGNSSAWSIWISDCIWNCNVCIFETYFFKEVG